MTGTQTSGHGTEESGTDDTGGSQEPEAQTEVLRPPPRARPPRPQKRWWLRHYTFFGTAVGLVFIWLSMTPSLLPRGPLFQGIVSGAAGAIGYGLGVFGVWLVRYMRSKETSPACAALGLAGVCSSSASSARSSRSSGSTCGRTTSATSWACRDWASGTIR